jgi:hypothetical protein
VCWTEQAVGLAAMDVEGNRLLSMLSAPVGTGPEATAVLATMAAAVAIASAIPSFL